MPTHDEPQPATGTAPPVLAAVGVSMTFGGATALRAVDFEVRAGEVHALVGMNGAGKSTLVGILSGALRPDEGELTIDGARVGSLTPRRAREHGIATVPQRRDLVPQLTVAENLFLGRLPRRLGIVDWRGMRRDARAALQAIGIGIDPRTPTGSLSAAEQTMVEIAREVRHGGRVLILDEPTATLGGAAAAEVRGLVRRLRNQGRAIVYITHHLDEILELADRVTVLRDGVREVTVDTRELDTGRLIRAMAGRDVDTERPLEQRVAGEEKLRIAGLTVGHRLAALDLTVRAGEVVALLGPAGDGQSALFPALSGASRPDAGELRVDGEVVPWGSVARSLRSGLRCVTGDRLARGLVGELTVDENILMARDRFDRRRLVNWRELRRRAGELRDRFGVVALQADPPVARLSGGNQQKVLLAKWLESSPAVCLLEEPTNGVDVAAKAEIHRMIDELAARGSAVLLASSDVQEVLRLADRIAVLSAGRLRGIREAATTSRDELVALTVGEFRP